MRQRDPARVQLQLQAFGQLGGGLIAVFRITQNRMADRLHVGAQLVGAAGERAQRHPGRLLAGARQGDVFGVGWFGPELLGIGLHDQFAIADALLDQRHLDHALGRPGRTGDDGPIGLLRPSLGEGT